LEILHSKGKRGGEKTGFRGGGVSNRMPDEGGRFSGFCHQIVSSPRLKRDKMVLMKKKAQRDN